MQTVRLLRQPGLTHPGRIDCFRGELHALRFMLKQGVTLNEAMTAPLVKSGFQGGTVTFAAAGLHPFHYVMPGPPDDPSHVAYFTASRASSGIAIIEQANATFGWQTTSRPFIVTPPGPTRAANDGVVTSCRPKRLLLSRLKPLPWGFRTIRIDAKSDPETNFTLFQPSGTTTGHSVFTRIKPNQDLLTVLETIACTCGIKNATVRGSLGSLVGASFIDGTRVADDATEVLVQEGCIQDGKAALKLLVVDMQGSVHEGWVQRDQNPICITFNILLEPVATDVISRTDTTQ